MKEFTVNLDHITRKKVTLLAENEIDAVMQVHRLLATTDLAEQMPVIRTTDEITCGDTWLGLPSTTVDPKTLFEEYLTALCGEADEDEINLVAMLTGVRDEVEAALEHLDSALADLFPDEE